MKKYILILLFVINSLFFTCNNSLSSLMPIDDFEITRMENSVFGKSFNSIKINDRLNKMEKALFGKTFINENVSERIERVRDYLLGYSDDLDTNKGYENNVLSQNYENYETRALSQAEFEESFLQILNDQRSFMGFLPLIKDEVAVRVASEQSADLLSMGNLSYFNSKGLCPDERYTITGGTGALIEIVKGFELDKKIVLNELLIKQLLEALSVSQDDSQVLFSPYLTHIGYGFSLSPDGKKFVSVIEFLTKGGSIEPIKIFLNPAQKLTLKGSLKKPYKFKAISVGYLSDQELLDFNSGSKVGFDSSALKPYFPPQNYIAYGDNTRVNFLKVLGGIGVIGAIGAAPFTGGASAVLAPMLLNSIQNGTPKEIPLKGGMKTSSNGDFHGEIDLNYQGKTGLYFVSILAEMPGLTAPIVVSRRTVRVGFKPLI